MIIALYYHCATGECGGVGMERVIPLPRWRGEGEGDTPTGGAGKEREIPPQVERGRRGGYPPLYLLVFL